MTGTFSQSAAIFVYLSPGKSKLCKFCGRLSKQLSTNYFEMLLSANIYKESFVNTCNRDVFFLLPKARHEWHL